MHAERRSTDQPGLPVLGVRAGLSLAPVEMGEVHGVMVIVGGPGMVHRLRDGGLRERVRRGRPGRPPGPLLRPDELRRRRFVTAATRAHEVRARDGVLHHFGEEPAFLRNPAGRAQVPPKGQAVDAGFPAQVVTATAFGKEDDVVVHVSRAVPGLVELVQAAVRAAEVEHGVEHAVDVLVGAEDVLGGARRGLPVRGEHDEADAWRYGRGEVGGAAVGGDVVRVPRWLVPPAFRRIGPLHAVAVRGHVVVVESERHLSSQPGSHAATETFSTSREVGEWENGGRSRPTTRSGITARWTSSRAARGPFVRPPERYR